MIFILETLQFHVMCTFMKIISHSCNHHHLHQIFPPFLLALILLPMTWFLSHPILYNTLSILQILFQHHMILFLQPKTLILQILLSQIFLHCVVQPEYNTHPLTCRIITTLSHQLLPIIIQVYFIQLRNKFLIPVFLMIFKLLCLPFLLFPNPTHMLKLISMTAGLRQCKLN